MKSIEIRGTNAHPGAPIDWDAKRDGHCGILAVRVDYDNHAGTTGVVKTCQSAWVPSPAELVRLNRGGHVVLTVFGWQVPVSLTVEEPYPEAEEAKAREPLGEKLAPAKLPDATPHYCGTCARMGQSGCPEHYWQRRK